MLADNDSLLGENSSAAARDPLTGGISFNNDIDSDRNILEVTSIGEVTVPTSITTVDLGIEVQGETAQEVQQEVAQQTTNVVDVLEKLEVKELQTTSVRLFPVYSFENDTRTLTGFEARNSLSFELPNQEAGAAIDAAVAAGANQIQNISFSASDEALQQARLQALKQAIEQAQTEAATVFDTLNLVSQEIVGIEILSVGESNPISQPLRFEASAARDTTPIIGSPQTVQATVALDILYSEQ
ncbi:MAG: SIMPL domain-containing protein [Rivularia sp. (in: Bacteria)]|nr:SIMPL domain-containing protein [Rivularia sp. MS3]